MTEQEIAKKLLLGIEICRNCYCDYNGKMDIDQQALTEDTFLNVYIFTCRECGDVVKKEAIGTVDPKTLKITMSDPVDIND